MDEQRLARHLVHGTKLAEGMLNRVETVIRAFDPCLSCSTHAAGEMPREIQLLASYGQMLDAVRR